MNNYGSLDWDDCGEIEIVSFDDNPRPSKYCSWYPIKVRSSDGQVYECSWQTDKNHTPPTVGTHQVVCQVKMYQTKKNVTLKEKPISKQGYGGSGGKGNTWEPNDDHPDKIARIARGNAANASASISNTRALKI